MPDSNATALEFLAARDESASSQPFQILMLEPTAVPPRAFPVVAPLRGRHAPPGGMLLNETDTLWLTVGAR